MEYIPPKVRFSKHEKSHGVDPSILREAIERWPRAHVIVIADLP